MRSFFHPQEFDCHDGTRYPSAWIDSRLAKLLRVLNPARERWGAPWRVVSGFRTEAWNLKVGGRPHSLHLRGDAADIVPIDVNNLATSDVGLVGLVSSVHELILDMVASGDLLELGGLGYYPGKWVHLDTRPRGPDGELTLWRGTGVGSEPPPTLPKPPGGEPA